jgi:hypothetical protein
MGPEDIRRHVDPHKRAREILYRGDYIGLHEDYNINRFIF